MPNISADDVEEENKIFDFIKTRCPELSEEYLKVVRELYPGKTLEEVQKFAVERDERIEREKKEEQQRKFKERKERLQELIKTAKIPKIFSDVRAKDFKMSSRNELAAKTAINAINANNGLFIYGECGTGKTMLASVIANERAELLKPSLFIGAVDIFQELNPYCSDSRTASNRKAVVKSVPCLIIDDLGAEKPSDWTKQTLFEIIDYRYREKLQTIITSNFSLEGLKSEGRIGNIKERVDYEGNRIIRRIKAICDLVELHHY